MAKARPLLMEILKTAIAAAIVIPLCIGVWKLISSDFSKSETEDPCRHIGSAYFVLTETIRPQLLAPSSAKFADIVSNDVGYRFEDGCRIRISSYVDAQNAFGAMLRTNFSAVMVYHPEFERWEITNLRGF